MRAGIGVISNTSPYISGESKDVTRSKRVVHLRYAGYIDGKDFESHLTTRQRLSQGTIVTRRSRIDIFYKWLKTNNLKIDSNTVEKFFYYLETEKKLTGSSLNTYYNALHSLQGYLIARGVSKDFMSGFRLFRETEPEITPLSKEEIKLLKDACKVYSYDKVQQVKQELIIFLIDTGSRWEDAQYLKCSSVDLAAREVSYIQLKTGRRRTVHLEDPLLSILRKETKNKKPEGLVFQNSKGNTVYYPDFYFYLKHLAKKLGIIKRVSPHILRHSYAQNFYEQTGDLYLLKDIIGHGSINSTMRYLRNSKVRIKNAQMMHPHLADNVRPQAIIKQLKNDIESRGLEADERFDSNKVRKAINQFIENLHTAIH